MRGCHDLLRPCPPNFGETKGACLHKIIGFRAACSLDQCRLVAACSPNQCGLVAELTEGNEIRWVL